MKPSRRRWAGQVVCIGKIKMVYKIAVGKPEA
jgi:hypothetical protein